jgi:hypothetical protein
MRINQIHHVEIDHRTLSVNCNHCRALHLLEDERLSLHGFVVHATRLAKSHRNCASPNHAARADAIARELQGLMESEAEEMQLALEGRGHVVPFARGVTTTSDAPGMKVMQPLERGPGRPPISAEKGSLCLVCELHYTVTDHRICYRCSTRYSMKSCLNKVRLKLQEAAPIRAHDFAAGAGGAN